MSRFRTENPDNDEACTLSLNHEIPTAEQDLALLKIVKKAFEDGVFQTEPVSPEEWRIRQEADDAYLQLVAGKQRLVRKLALKILLNHGMNQYDDPALLDILQNAGSTGITEAIHNFNLDASNSFTTYVLFWINKYIRDTYHLEQEVVNKPEMLRYRQKVVLSVMEELNLHEFSQLTNEHIILISERIAEQNLFQSKRSVPSLDEVRTEVELVLRSFYQLNVASLNDPLGDEEDDLTLADVISAEELDIEEQMSDQESYLRIMTAVKELKPREQKFFAQVLAMLGSGKNESQYAQSLGISRATFNIRKKMLFTNIRRIATKNQTT